MEKLPWLDYTGQTTSELLACKNTHRIASLLCAFEWGIQAKIGPGGEDELTKDEQLVLAVMALQREVNNGGYSQFFTNCSRRFVPIIVDSLQNIGCAIVADITKRAIIALRIEHWDPDSVSDAALNAGPDINKTLDALDTEFYQIGEIDYQLFQFIEAHQNNIQLRKGAKPPVELRRPKRSNAAQLSTYLTFAKLQGRSLQELRDQARDVARQRTIEVTDADIDAALTLYLFDRALCDGDVAACEELAPQAFKLMREDGTHCVLHKKWVERLIQEARFDLADTSTLYYLEYVETCDQSALKTRNTVLFWATLLQENRATLAKSVEFFTRTFPEVDLEQLPPSRVIRVPKFKTPSTLM